MALVVLGSISQRLMVLSILHVLSAQWLLSWRDVYSNSLLIFPWILLCYCVVVRVGYIFGCWSLISYMIYEYLLPISEMSLSLSFKVGEFGFKELTFGFLRILFFHI